MADKNTTEELPTVNEAMKALFRSGTVVQQEPGINITISNKPIRFQTNTGVKKLAVSLVSSFSDSPGALHSLHTKIRTSSQKKSAIGID